MGGGGESTSKHRLVSLPSWVFSVDLMENVYLSYSLQEGPPGSKDLPMFWRGPQGPANKEENKEENM